MNRVAEPKKRSRFIAEAVRQKIEQKEKEEMEKLLVEGYQAAAKESLATTEEFEIADLEGWDDYQKRNRKAAQKFKNKNRPDPDTGQASTHQAYR